MESEDLPYSCLTRWILPFGQENLCACGERSLLTAPVMWTLDGEFQGELLTSHRQPLITCSNRYTSLKRSCDCEELGSVLSLKEKMQGNQPF